MRPSKHIEEQIRQKMENLETGYDPSSWDMLAHRIDFEAQQAVDKLFEDRIGPMTVPLAPNSWEAMEQMIASEEAAELIENEAPIDNVAYEKLHGLQSPYKEHHWSLMAKRLEEEYSLRHQLYRYKVAELVLMALLVLTIVRFLPLVEGKVQPVQTFDRVPVLEQKRPTAPAVKTFAPQLPISAPVQSDKAVGVPIASLQSSQYLPKLQVDLALPLLASIDSPPFSPIKNGLTIGTPFDEVNADEQGQNSYLPVKKLAPLTASSGSAARLEEIVEKNTKRNNFISSKLQAAAPLTMATLPIGQVSSTYEWELPTIKNRPAKKHNDLRFGVFTTTDFNYITTPPNQITVFGESVKTNYNETMASGYGGGLNVSWKRGRWEYQTGGIYSFKRYIPNTPIFIFDTPNFFIKEDFNGIQLDIFQLPLNALYHFKNTGKWHFYTSVGASAHFITATVYEIDHKSEALRTNPDTSPDESKSITNETQSSLDFPSGLLDGGRFRGNFYLSANLGVGVERYLSPKWTVFFQPNYQHYLMSEGIGDNKDKIYTTSFYLGTKFNLK